MECQSQIKKPYEPSVQLAELMIRYDLGVTVKDTYQVKSLDTDYFAEG
jgi:restriction endonuclease Mrr